MKEITPKRIKLQREADGFYWLVIPHAMINLNNSFSPIVRRNFLKWAEEEFNVDSKGELHDNKKD